jgi:hypothetical protein
MTSEKISANLSTVHMIELTSKKFLYFSHKKIYLINRVLGDRRTASGALLCPQILSRH